MGNAIVEEVEEDRPQRLRGLFDRLADVAERDANRLRGFAEVMRAGARARLPLLGFRDDSEQEVHTRYAFVSLGLGYRPGQSDDPVRPRRVRNPADRTRSCLFVALRDEDSTRDSKLEQGLRAEALWPREDPKYDVLGADVVVVRRSRFGLSTGEHLSGLIAEAP